MKESTQLNRVLIMAGGTGGHVFPGLAVATYLREKGVEVHWLGTESGLEAKLIPTEHIPLHLIKVKGIRGKGFKPYFTAPFQISLAIKQSIHILRKVDPDVVIGMGGFVSGPGGIASWLTQRPLIIHEQNAKAGFTNKLLALFAKRVLTGFPSSFKSNAKVITIGNPVRSDILNLPSPKTRRKSPHKQAHFRLLILGGSLGAQALNKIVPSAIASLDEKDRPEIIHQTGEKHFLQTQTDYRERGVSAQLQSFIKDMGEAYAWADLVLCRAGALTVAELCAAGLGSILVPFPFAVDDHQTANAYFMVENHAALCIQQTELTAERLADIVRQLTHSPDKRFAMAEAAYGLRQVNVTEKIFEICKGVCH